MAYDEDLANRIREVLADVDAVTERKMFGGLAFMVGGNMAVCITGSTGELMVRVGKENADAMLEKPHARVMDMSGRPMRGFVLVAPPGFKDKRSLRAWADRGVEFARSLPQKA